MRTRNGILKVIPKQTSYYTKDDVVELLGVSDDKAYKMMRRMRLELIDKGVLAPDYPCGKIPKVYFNARCGIETEVTSCITEPVRSVGVI